MKEVEEVGSNQEVIAKDQALDEKGRINQQLWDALGGLQQKIKGIKGADSGISDPDVKKNLHEKIIEFTSRSVPQGAAKSMSPYLLANTF